MGAGLEFGLILRPDLGCFFPVHTGTQMVSADYLLHD
jgi:hypothetical protein